MTTTDEHFPTSTSGRYSTDRPAQVDGWPATHVCIAAVSPRGVVASIGDLDRPYGVASITKPLVATAVLLAVEEGSVGLDDPCGPDGSTVRHLLSHASGLAPDESFRLAAPGTRRIYSNVGYEVLAAHLERATGLSMAQYLHEGVCDALGMDSTRLNGSPAHGVTSTVADLTRWVTDLLSPALVLSPTTVGEARSVQYPGLAGVLPGYGHQPHNDWGLGFEIRDTKSPHWTGTTNSPETFGHFGKSGGFVWIDPVARLGVVALGDADFGDWALDLWPAISDSILAEHGTVV